MTTPYSHPSGSTQSVNDLWPNKLVGAKTRFRNELAKLSQPGQIGDPNYLMRMRDQPLEDRLRTASVMGVPIASDVAGLAADAMMYKRDPSSRTVGNALLSGLGMLPIIPAMTAYHGSPHKFDKFELSDKTIGTGEGAQAYGHGLYFAEDPSVAKSYKSALSQNPFPSGDQRHGAWHVYNFKGEDAAKKYLADALPPDQVEPALQQLKQAQSGALYHVDIPDDSIAKMLDWDAPLSEQPEAVRKAINESGLRLPESVTGEQIYRAVSSRSVSDLDPSMRGTTGYNDRAASDKLRSLGIPGIRYLDGGSRAAGDGTRNFVVFDDSILKILNRE